MGMGVSWQSTGTSLAELPLAAVVRTRARRSMLMAILKMMRSAMHTA